ncbi:MAG TPA: hypothetical protein VNT60_04335 [Deinococcales bacterium]|nr:hypothetical protein [Deinococcales bacterium]
MIDWGYASLNEAHARQARYRDEARRDALANQARTANLKAQAKQPDRPAQPKTTQLRRGHA